MLIFISADSQLPFSAALFAVFGAVERWILHTFPRVTIACFRGIMDTALKERLSNFFGCVFAFAYGQPPNFCGIMEKIEDFLLEECRSA